MPRFAIGELTVLAELGAGAGSRVFHVRRWSDSAEYALKVVAADRRADPRFLEQLRHEDRVGQMLDHPNVTKVFALELQRDWLFRPTTARLLVEFAAGQPLSKLPSLDVSDLLPIFERVAAALAHLHSRGVFHADIKPSNIIYDSSVGGVKIIDLGLAWIAGEPKSRVQGTPQYVAPETATQRIVNARTDVYSLGATMYHLVTRRQLPARQMGGVMSTRPPAAPEPVSSLNPVAPPELCDLIHRCISHDPSNRPSEAREVQAVLRRLVNPPETK